MGSTIILMNQMKKWGYSGIGGQDCRRNIPSFLVNPHQDWDLHSGHIVCPGNGLRWSVASMISLLNVGNKIFVLILVCYAVYYAKTQ